MTCVCLCVRQVRAKQQHHRFLIGRNGANIRKIRDATGARIIFPTDKDEDKELITIIGKKVNTHPHPHFCLFTLNITIVYLLSPALEFFPHALSDLLA